MPIWIDGDAAGARLVCAPSPDGLAELLGFERDRRFVRFVDDEEIEQIRDELGDRAFRNLARLLRRLIARLAPNADIEDIVGRPSRPFRRLDPTETIFLVDVDGIRRAYRISDLEQASEGILADRVSDGDGRLRWKRR